MTFNSEDYTQKTNFVMRYLTHPLLFSLAVIELRFRHHVV